jgi:Predicted membrane protein (DUF2142)
LARYEWRALSSVGANTMRVKIALVLGLLLMAIAIFVTLTRAPPTVAGSDSTALQGFIAETSNSASLCQQGETLPQGTTAIRLSLYTIFGPRVAVHVYSGARLLTSGERGAGWTAEGPTVPVRRVPRTVANVKVCIAFGHPLGGISVNGGFTSSASAMTSGAGEPLSGRMRIEYLKSGDRSWWSLTSAVAMHMGLGRWPAGTWIVFVALALMVAVLVCTVRLTVATIGADIPESSDEEQPGEPSVDVPSERALGAPVVEAPDIGAPAMESPTMGAPATESPAMEAPAMESPATGTSAMEVPATEAPATAGTRAASRGRPTMRQALARIPRAAKVCALVAFLNAACWSLVTPAFQVTDEPDHVAYVQQLAEGRSLPHKTNSREYSAEEATALRDLHENEIQFSPATHTITTRAEQQTLEHDLSQPLGRKGSGGAGTATSDPPLYYALQTIPYALGSGGTILERLTLMRLLSAFMAGLTALFAFLFLREALPRVPWAWTVGGLGVAVAPLLGFISGGVNPDAMLFAVSAAIFYLLARAFRRRLTRRLAAAISLAMVIGFLTKLNFIGLAPGIVLGMFLLVRREARASGREVYLHLLVPALLIALSPVLLYALVNLVSGDPLLGIASGGIDALTGAGHSITRELSFTWQLYLPRLPGMHDYFQEVFTTRQIWFDGLVGLYGWLDTVFPGWVYNAALVPAALIGALCVRELVVNRSSVRSRLRELITYATMSVGVLVLVGLSGYQGSSMYAAAFAEPRYLLPMLALWGAVIALAARGAGRRWGPVVGTLIVVLLLSHDIFSQLQVIARFYG